MASRQRTGVAAILAGALIFAGQGGELVFDDTAGALWVTLGIGGFLALAVAIWGLRELVGATRMGRVGMRMALVGGAILCLFAVQVAVEQVRTGEIPAVGLHDSGLFAFEGAWIALVSLCAERPPTAAAAVGTCSESDAAPTLAVDRADPAATPQLPRGQLPMADRPLRP